MELYNCDSTSLIKQFPSDTIDLIVTDPPYRVTGRGSTGTTGGMLQKKLFKSGKVFRYNDVNVFEYSKEFFRILKDGSHCYIMTNHVNLHEMLNAFTNAGFHFIKLFGKREIK